MRLPLLVLAACTADGPGRAVVVPEDAVLDVQLVPRPVSLSVAPGAVVFDEGTRICVDPALVDVAERLAADLRGPTGLPLPVEEACIVADGDIWIGLDRSLGAEAYRLEIEDAVLLLGGDRDGAYWGTRTLVQLLPAAASGAAPVDATWAVPRVSIDDAPAYPWRGHMLDVARHFFTVDDVKRQIDAMAAHKLNRLHLHLTDDSGWRIEIESWPLLAEVGGATEVGGGPGGFYTQAEYAELVAYAADRSIVVVPEIDFPGHCNAALASYAELNPDGETAEPFTGIGVGFSTLWLDGPDTHRFVEDVWAEVVALTPGPWVHIGADESDATDPDDYAAFVPWLQGVLEDHGKEVIGWDEVAEAPMTPGFTAQWWEDEERAADAVAGGGQLIASPAAHAYLDMVHDWDADFGTFWAGPTSVSDGYLWDPVPPGVDPAAVVGVEAPLWTEYIETRSQMDLMTWPRLAGIAELGWSGSATDWEDYRARLAVDGERLEAMGIEFYRSPEVDWD